MAKLGITIATNVRNYRTLRGLSQSELAVKIKSVQKTVSNYETEASGITLEMLRRIAGALDIEETDLAYPGVAPEAIVVKPSPEEALDIIAKALRAKTPAIEDPRLAALVARWPDLEKDVKDMALTAAGVSLEADESQVSKPSKG